MDENGGSNRSSSGRPSIAVVVLDTLRKDSFDEHFDWLPGRRFENAWAPSHWTIPVHASLFTGQYASEVGVHAKNVTFDYPEESLAERLSSAGYTTRAFCSNPNISPVFDFDRGFDEFEGGWRLKEFDPQIFHWDRFINETQGEGPQRFLKAIAECVRSECSTVPSLRHGLDLKLRDLRLGWAKDDGAIATRRWFERTTFGDEEFLFVNLMEAHSPYDPPDEYKTVDVASPMGVRATIDEPEADPEDLRQAYDDAVRYLSDKYREIFAELEATFDYVVTLSDHGELFGERGGWEHLCGLDPELTHVPLTVSGGGLDGSASELVSLLDVHATVLELAGVDSSASRGQSLLGEFEERPFLTEYHGLRDDHRDSLVADGYDAIPYDTCLLGIGVPSDFYGYETLDGWRADGTPNSEADPRELLDSLAAERDVRDVAGEDVTLSAEAKAQLEDLGYV